MLILGYFAAALAVLIALALMILAITRALGDCPEKGPRARAAGVTIATGYLALGAGAVMLKRFSSASASPASCWGWASHRR
jgi:hypothetical protein